MPRVKLCSVLMFATTNIRSDHTKLIAKGPGDDARARKNLVEIRLPLP